MATISTYVSAATNKVITADIEEQIARWSAHYKLEEALVRAVIETESEKSMYAIRMEPHLKKARWYVKALPEQYKELDFAYCSMGLMQVLYGVARGDGYRGTPFELLNPESGIRWGCRRLYLLKRKYGGNVKNILAAYNAGAARFAKGEDGKVLRDKAGNKVYRNQRYVTKSYRHYRKFGGES